jgi:hypothetical protein
MHICSLPYSSPGYTQSEYDRALSSNLLPLPLLSLLLPHGGPSLRAPPNTHAVGL